MLPKLPSWAMGAREIRITLIMVHSGVTAKKQRGRRFDPAHELYDLT